MGRKGARESTLGFPKGDAEIQASHRLLPVYCKKLPHLYLQYLRWYHKLKTDPVHKKVVKTLRSFMEDDEMDYTEAVEAPISKWKYLLNSLFDLEHFPTEDPASTEDDFTYEPMKRKYWKGGTLNRGTDDTLNKLAALNELCASVLYPPSWPLLCLSSQRRSILQSNYSRPDIPASSKRLFRPMLQRQNAIIDKTMRMRNLSQQGFLHP